MSRSRRWHSVQYGLHSQLPCSAIGFVLLPTQAGLIGVRRMYMPQGRTGHEVSTGVACRDSRWHIPRPVLAARTSARCRVRRLASLACRSCMSRKAGSNYKMAADGPQWQPRAISVHIAKARSIVARCIRCRWCCRVATQAACTRWQLRTYQAPARACSRAAAVHAVDACTWRAALQSPSCNVAGNCPSLRGGRRCQLRASGAATAAQTSRARWQLCALAAYPIATACEQPTPQLLQTSQDCYACSSQAPARTPWPREARKAADLARWGQLQARLQGSI
jgi:hypothetical protein